MLVKKKKAIDEEELTPEEKYKKKQKEKRKRWENKLVDKQGRDKYPYYEASQTLYKLSKFLIIMTLILIITPILCSWLNTLLVPFFKSKEIMGILSFIVGMFGFDASHIPVAVHHGLTSISNLAHNIVHDYYSIPIISVLAYWFTMVMRMHYGEEEPFRDDAFARRLKKTYVNELVKIKPTFSEQINGQETKTEAEEYERRAKEIIRAMKVEVHTRKEVGGRNFYRKGEIVIEKPKDVQLVAQMKKYIDPMIEHLQVASGGQMTFRFLLDAKQTKYMFRSTPKDVSDVYEAIIEKHRKRREKLEGVEEGEKEIPSQYVFPLDIIKLRNSNDEERLEKIKSWGESIALQVETSLTTRSTYVELNHKELGTASLALMYQIGDFTKQTSNHTLEEELSRFLDIEGIMVDIRAGKMTITIPVPKELQLSMDMSRVFQDVFGKAERLK